MADEIKKREVQSSIDMENELLGARDAARELADALAIGTNNSKKVKEVQKKVYESLRSQTDVSQQLNTLIQQRDLYIQNEIKLGLKTNKRLMEQLDIQIEILAEKERLQKLEEEHKELLKKQKDLREEQNTKIKEALGYSSELADLFATGGVMALGAQAFTSAIEKTKEAFSAATTMAIDLHKNLGVAGGEAARLAGEIQSAATFSLLYDTQQMSEAASALADKFNTTNGITSDLLEDVAEIGALTGDAASGAGLANIFEQAAGDAGELTSEIKDIAAGVGVSASVVMKDMAANQGMLVGKTKEEIKLLAKKTAELTKQGLSMGKMREMADNMLNIESSLKAESKARAMGLGDMLGDTQAMRAAAMEIQYGDATKGAEMMSAAIKDAGITSEKFGKLDYKRKEMLAATFGMTSDAMREMLETSEKNEEMVNKYGETGAEAMGYLKAGFSSAIEGSKTLLVEMVKLVAQLSVMNVMQGKGMGIGNLNPFKKKGGGGGAPKPEAPKPEAPKVSAGGGKGMSSMTGAIEKIDAKKLLAGGAALVLVAASVFIFAKAVQEFTEVGWKEVGMAIVSMVALVGALALVGTIMSSGVGAVAILAGAAAMIVIAGAMYVLGKAIQEIATGFSMLGELGTQLTELVSIAPGMLLLAYSFGVLGASMIPLAAGLALITPFIGTLAVLGTMLPLINNSLNGGSNSNDTTSETKTDTMGELLSEIKGLRNDLQSQPILLTIDGKAVQKITRVQSRQSVTTRGFN